MAALHSPEPISSNASGWQSRYKQLQRERIYSGDRLSWMMDIRETVESQTLSNNDRLLLLDLAQRLCDWSMVIYLCKHLLPEKSALLRGQKAGIAMDCADAFLQIGLPQFAIDVLRKALLQDYQNTELFLWYRSANDEQRKLQNQPVPPDQMVTEDILLTPLTSDHIESFRWIYSQYAQRGKENCLENQSIAQLCNLPRFKNDKHWQRWLLRRQKERNVYLYAVVHKEWGMIGSVSLEMFGDIGFFYYWLGEDFQGLGFGPKAVKFLLSLGERYLGLRCCYAKVYNYNYPSQKALEKIGFRQLPIEVISPHHDEQIFYFGSETSISCLHAELCILLRDMNSDLVVKELIRINQI